MRGFKVLFVMFLSMGLVGAVYAAPVGLTSEADATEAEFLSDKDLSVKVGFVADILNERDIDIDSGSFEMMALSTRLTVGLIDRISLYLDIGEAQDMEFSWIKDGDNIRVFYDDDLIWGLGASALLYRWDNGVELGANGYYRDAETKIDRVEVLSNSYTRTQLDDITKDGDYEEFQVGLELAFKTELMHPFIPYLGIKYSDVEVGSIFQADGQAYSVANQSADVKVGVFAGCSFVPAIAPLNERLSINVEARMIDESAISAAVNYTF